MGGPGGVPILPTEAERMQQVAQLPACPNCNGPMMPNMTSFAALTGTADDHAPPLMPDFYLQGFRCPDCTNKRLLGAMERATTPKNIRPLRKVR